MFMYMKNVIKKKRKSSRKNKRNFEGKIQNPGTLRNYENEITKEIDKICLLSIRRSKRKSMKVIFRTKMLPVKVKYLSQQLE